MILAGTLADRRPSEVTARIETDYAMLAQGVDLYQNTRTRSYEHGYDDKGSHEQYNWQKLNIRSGALLKQDGLHVLDLGCGAGRIVREYNARNPDVNRAYGITANTYGHSDPAIIVGNVHYLDDLYPAALGPVDLSISRLMYMHLADPLSVLAMMAGHIRKGGLMAVDGFPIRARIGSRVASHVVSYLLCSGHFALISNNAADVQKNYIDSPEMCATTSSSIMPSMLLERTSPTSATIDLPITYDTNHRKTDWRYTT